MAGLANAKSKGVKLGAKRKRNSDLIRELQSQGLLFKQNGGLLSYRTIQNVYNSTFKKLNMPYTSTHCFRTGSATNYYNTTSDLSGKGTSDSNKNGSADYDG